MDHAELRQLARECLSNNADRLRENLPQLICACALPSTARCAVQSVDSVLTELVSQGKFASGEHAVWLRGQRRDFLACLVGLVTSSPDARLQVSALDAFLRCVASASRDQRDFQNGLLGPLVVALVQAPKKTGGYRVATSKFFWPRWSISMCRSRMGGSLGLSVLGANDNDHESGERRLDDQGP